MYRVNSPQVISETVGGETIIVNLASGHYFSLQVTAVDVWEGVERGESAETIALQLGQRYEAAEGEIGAAVQQLLDGFAAASCSWRTVNGTGSSPVAPARMQPSASPSSLRASRRSPTCKTSSCSTRFMRSTLGDGRMPLPAPDTADGTLETSIERAGQKFRARGPGRRSRRRTLDSHRGCAGAAPLRRTRPHRATGHAFDHLIDEEPRAGRS